MPNGIDCQERLFKEEIALEQFDQQMEQRVWKRVRGEEQPPITGLQGLAAAEQNEAAVYLMLSRQLQGPEKAMLRRIFEQENAHAAILRGIHNAMTGQRITLRTAPVQPETPEIALRKCYARKLKTLSEYESRENDREYGAVFSHLARQEREHCAVILQILGSR